MSTKDIERLAKALRTAPVRGAIASFGSFETTMAKIEAAQQEQAEDQVRAILKALREPDQDTQVAGIVGLVTEITRIDGPRPKLTQAQMEGTEEVSDEVMANYYMSIGATTRSGTEITAAWQAMIDHILAD